MQKASLAEAFLRLSLCASAPSPDASARIDESAPSSHSRIIHRRLQRADRRTRVGAALSVKFGIGISPSSCATAWTKRQDGTPVNAGTANLIAQRAPSAGARLAGRHSWTDEAESASV
ncbi:hypothetical protein BCEN4_910027 [Burkholderia cenocepacia]|nr:hypothetical protein BCEN4_910027 [Burkholderia cenocepacia]